MNAFRSLALPLTFLALCGCSVLSGEGTTQQNYVLSAPTWRAEAPAPLHLKVLPVEVASGLDTPRIALLDGAKLIFVADAKWAEALPQMLQFLWIDALRRSHVATSVSSDAIGAKADKLIALSVGAFQAERTETGALRVHVRLEAQILSPLSHAVLSVDTAESVLEASSPDLASVMHSFNAANAEASADLLKKISARLRS